VMKGRGKKEFRISEKKKDVNFIGASQKEGKQVLSPQIYAGNSLRGKLRIHEQAMQKKKKES